MKETVAASARSQSAWKWVTLADVGKVITGNTPPTADAENYGDAIPFVKPTELVDRGIRSAPSGLAPQAMGKARVVPAGAVLVSCIGNLGKTGIAKVPLAFNQQINAVVFNENVVPEFGFYYAQTLKPWLYGESSATTIPIVNKGKFQQARFPLAPLDEQREIVAELEKQFSRLDEAVANLQRVKANLKRYKDSVYSEAFGSAPNSTLGELIEVGPQNGLYLPKDMYGDGVPILRIDDYQTAWIRPVQELRRVKATQEQISTWALCEDDLVVNRVNSMTHLGKCVRIPKSLAGTVFESNMMRIRLTAAASPKYVEHYLASRLGKKRLTGNAKWAVNQASINQKDVRATPIFVPDLAAQLALVTEIDRQLSIVREVEVEVDTNIKRSQALRQATLSKAFPPHS